jgi:hypothetical protein
MANVMSNVARGRMRQYYDSVDSNLVIATGPIQSTANAALLVVPIETTGIEGDAALVDYDDLSALLAAANNEQTTLGRKTITDTATGASVQDDTNERLDLDIPDQTWTAGAGAAISKLTIDYDPDTTAGTDTTVVPLTFHDFAVTPDGSDITAQIAATGYYRSQ